MIETNTHEQSSTQTSRGTYLQLVCAPQSEQRPCSNRAVVLHPAAQCPRTEAGTAALARGGMVVSVAPYWSLLRRPPWRMRSRFRESWTNLGVGGLFTLHKKAETTTHHSNYGDSKQQRDDDNNNNNNNNNNNKQNARADTVQM